MVHYVNRAPPVKGVVYRISDWLMLEEVVAGVIVTLNELEAWPVSDTMWRIPASS